VRSLSELLARVRDEAFVCEVSWCRCALAKLDMERGVVVSTLPMRHFVDHVFFTMDHVAPHYSREMLADIALSAFGVQDCTDPHEFRGVVVKETNSDGTDHLHGCFSNCWSCGASVFS